MRSLLTICCYLITYSVFAFSTSIQSSNQSHSNINIPRIQMLGKHKWYPWTFNINGPSLVNGQPHSEDMSNPNPFLDYKVDVTFSNGSTSMIVPAFYAGDGQGNGVGNIWQVRFAAPLEGIWTASVNFKSGANANIDDNVSTTVLTNLNKTFYFFVEPLKEDAPGFLKYGLLEHIGASYLKFRDGPYFIKGGVNSPENLLGFAGFDDTYDDGTTNGNNLPSDFPSFVHYYPNHIADYFLFPEIPKPDFISNYSGVDSKGLVGALNYLSSKKVNSVYFIPMNLGGDGRETWPFLNPSGSYEDNTHYDVSKMYQWNQIFEYAGKLGLQLHIILGETEPGNESWLSAGPLGLGAERKLYYKMMTSMFSHNLAIKWTISEENDFSVSQLDAYANYIREVDPYDHPIAVHTHLDDIDLYDDILNGADASWLEMTAVQYRAHYQQANSAEVTQDVSDQVETLRSMFASTGTKRVIDMDENFSPSGLSSNNADLMRKTVLYPTYFSGGNIEWFMGSHPTPPNGIGGDQGVEDFRTREDMYDYMYYIRNMMVNNFPFWEMSPQDQLLMGENTTAFGPAQVFAKTNELYAVYIPNASSANMTLDLTGASLDKNFKGRWWNPREGLFEGSLSMTSGGVLLNIGQPPGDPQEDWVYLLQRVN